MPEKPTILLISGPGGDAFGEEEVKLATENFTKAGANVLVVGDGKRDVSLEEVIKTATKIQGEMTVFLNAHGVVRNGEHHVGLTDEHNTPSNDIFKQLAKARNGKPFDIFMTSCHGGAAQQSANKLLPKGSVLVDLAPGDQTVAGHDVKAFLKTVAENKSLASNLRGEHLLNDYLMSDLKNRIPPSLTVAGEGTYNLEGIFKARIGEQFSKEESENAHKTLDAAFGKEKVDVIIQQITSAKSEYDIGAVDFGPALAVAFAAHDRSKGGIQLPKDFKFPNSLNLDGLEMQPFPPTRLMPDQPKIPPSPPDDRSTSMVRALEQFNQADNRISAAGTPSSLPRRPGGKDSGRGM